MGTGGVDQRGLTLAPGLSAWGCWLALRCFVTWKPAAVPAALVYGYSAAIVASLLFGHVSVSVLVVPPLLLTILYGIVVRQDRTPRRDGRDVLAALVVVQFLISPEVLVMCALLAVVGLVGDAGVRVAQRSDAGPARRAGAGRRCRPRGRAPRLSGVVRLCRAAIGLGRAVRHSHRSRA